MIEMVIKWVGVSFFVLGGLYFFRLGRFIAHTESFTGLIKSLKQSPQLAPADIRVLLMFQTEILPGVYEYMYKVIGERRIDRLMKWGGFWIMFVGLLGVLFGIVIAFVSVSLFTVSG